MTREAAPREIFRPPNSLTATVAFFTVNDWTGLNPSAVIPSLRLEATRGFWKYPTSSGSVTRTISSGFVAPKSLYLVMFCSLRTFGRSVKSRSSTRRMNQYFSRVCTGSASSNVQASKEGLKNVFTALSNMQWPVL